MEEKNTLHRRTVIKGLGAGLTAMAIAPVFGQTKSTTGNGQSANLEDPTTKYPKPPFKAQ